MGEIINKTMRVIDIEISKLKVYEKNARIHSPKQIDLLVKNIEKFGFTTPVLIDENNNIIAGHGRLLALKKLNKDIVPCVRIEGLSEKEIKALRLADNQIASMADWDMSLVISELKGLDAEGFDIDLTGFDRDLLIGADEKDDIIPESAPKRAKRGELWALGRHLVYCGDSTNLADIQAIMGNKVIKLIFTSPPYNMAGGMYENYEDNLKSKEYIDFNIKVLSNFQKWLKGFVFWNISYNKNARQEFIEIIYKIIKETGLKFLELIVWDKGHALPITSKEGLTRQYEDVLLVGDQDSVKKDLELYFCGRNDKKAYFNKRTLKGITNYWRIGTNKTQLETHLACYPVALPVKGILLMTQDNDIIADPFLGSGSTLIACEKTNRICYGCEISPSYVDVIIKRYEDYTGNKAKIISDKTRK